MPAFSHTQVERILQDRLDNTTTETTYGACQNYLRVLLDVLSGEQGEELLAWGQQYIDEEVT